MSDIADGMRFYLCRRSPSVEILNVALPRFLYFGFSIPLGIMGMRGMGWSGVTQM